MECVLDKIKINLLIEIIFKKVIWFKMYLVNPESFRKSTANSEF